MNQRVIILFASVLMGLFGVSLNVQADEGTSNLRVAVLGNVQPFATLPRIINSTTGLAEGHPEGLCADSQGNIYADSFEQPTSAGYVQNYIYKFSPGGTLLSATATMALDPKAGGVVPLGCIVSGNKFYMNDVYNGDEYQYTLPLTASSKPTGWWHICGGFTGQPGPTCGLNANYPGPDGRIYMSDNGAALFGDTYGRIWVLNPNTGVSSEFIGSDQGVTQLAVAELPLDHYVPTGSTLPYGPNGIAFSRDGRALYIANMSTNIIYKQNVKNCSESTGCEPEDEIQQFSNDPLHLIQGPDNIDFDDEGHLWVASGQQQHVIALDREGNVVGIFGAFDGFNSQGAPIGLLQPSGIIFSRGQIYIGNESNQSLLPTSDDIDWNALQLFTISRVSTATLLGDRHHDDFQP